MATVQELKEALETEHARAIEVADRAITSIDTLLDLSMWVLGALGLVIALLAIFGYGLIANGAKKSAKTVATNAVDSYIKSQEFTDRVQSAVETEVKQRLTNKFIVANLTEEQDGGEPDPFPAPEKVEEQ